MVGLRGWRALGSAGRMLRMDQVHVVRHKVLVEGRSQRRVARELGISRVTVRKYVEQAAPVRQETGRGRGRCGRRSGARIEAVLADREVDRRQTAADRHPAARVAGGRGPRGRRRRS